MCFPRGNSIIVPCRSDMWPLRKRGRASSPPRAELAAAVAVVPNAACAQAPSVMPRIGKRGQKGFRSLTADARKRGSGNPLPSSGGIGRGTPLSITPHRVRGGLSGGGPCVTRHLLSCRRAETAPRRPAPQRSSSTLTGQDHRRVVPSGLNEPQFPVFWRKTWSVTSLALKIGRSQEF